MPRTSRQKQSRGAENRTRTISTPWIRTTTILHPDDEREIIKLLYYNELDYSFYDNLFKTIRTITSDRLMEMANKWLIEEEMLECVAGSRET